ARNAAVRPSASAGPRSLNSIRASAMERNGCAFMATPCGTMVKTRLTVFRCAGVEQRPRRRFGLLTQEPCQPGMARAYMRPQEALLVTMSVIGPSPSGDDYAAQLAANADDTIFDRDEPIGLFVEWLEEAKRSEPNDANA